MSYQFNIMPKKSKRISNNKLQKLITDYLSTNSDEKKNEKIENNEKKNIKIYGYDSSTDCWHCTICGENLGKSNPRQLCGKSFCYNDYGKYDYS